MSGFLDNFKTMNPYEIHKALVNTYLLQHPGDTKLFQRDTSKDVHDIDVLRQNHKFLWNEENPETWEEKLAKKYYDKLFKEYTISDLRLYKENKVALRWRTEQEVVSGKGQFSCGEKKCSEGNGLRTWEVNFAYYESNEKKNALVKLRLCPECSTKLNYKTKKREVKRLKIHRKSKDNTKKVSEDSSSESSMPSTSTEKPAVKETEISTNLWVGPVVAEKTREEVMEEYLEDLLF